MGQVGAHRFCYEHQLGVTASCERVFSLLANMFGDNQNSALGDLLQGSLMLRYNKREVG